MTNISNTIKLAAAVIALAVGMNTGVVASDGAASNETAAIEPATFTTKLETLKQTLAIKKQARIAVVQAYNRASQNYPHQNMMKNNGLTVYRPWLHDLKHPTSLLSVTLHQIRKEIAILEDQIATLEGNGEILDDLMTNLDSWLK